MDLATISMKELRKRGYLDDMEVSEEINAPMGCRGLRTALPLCGVLVLDASRP